MWNYFHSNLSIFLGNTVTTYTIADKKPYVPVVFLLTQGNTKTITITEISFLKKITEININQN